MRSAELFRRKERLCEQLIALKVKPAHQPCLLYLTVYSSHCGWLIHNSFHVIKNVSKIFSSGFARNISCKINLYGLNLDLDIVGRLICQLSRLSQDTHVPSYLMLVEQANLDLRDFFIIHGISFLLWPILYCTKSFYFEGYFCNWNNKELYIFGFKIP